MKKNLILFVFIFVFFYGDQFAVAAESGYPTRPIELTVGYSPGAWTDIGARLIAESAKKSLGQEIVVVNKPGGAGRLAMTFASKGKPDGYSLTVVTDSSVVLEPLREKVPYQPLEDFTFISQFGVLDFGVVVLPDSPLRTFKDIVDFARANPDKLTMGTPGVGSQNHVVFEALSRLENIKIRLVPFSGAALAITNLLGGHLMVASTGPSVYASHVKAKTLKLLAVLSEERVEGYPDVPTLKELGFPLIFQGRHIIVGPKNMERGIVDKLVQAFGKAMESPDFIKTAKELETWARKFSSGDELKEKLVQTYKRNEELFRKVGMGPKP